MSAPILHLDRVTKQFSANDLPAVAGVTLTLSPGEILALLGPSGCGKTTLLRLIAGFEAPTQGSILLAGQVAAQPGRCIAPERRSIGMVFQDFALFPHLTVAENIAFGLKQTTLLGKAAQERVAEAIALVNLQGKESCYPHQLSGGQQQRVALARALAPRPTLVLLDEPLSNLDVQVRLYLRQEIREILKATQTSAVFVTHDQEEAMAIADRVAVMRQGRLEQWGTPEDIYRQPGSRFVAEFVTQANFLPATQEASGWSTELCHLEKSQVQCSCQTACNHAEMPGLKGELMIRQEVLQVQPDEHGQATVSDRQFLGREYRYTVVTDSGKRLYVRTTASKAVAPGTRVSLTITDPLLRFFPS